MGKVGAGHRLGAGRCNDRRWKGKGVWPRRRSASLRIREGVGMLEMRSVSQESRDVREKEPKGVGWKDDSCEVVLSNLLANMLIRGSWQVSGLGSLGPALW